MTEDAEVLDVLACKVYQALEVFDEKMLSGEVEDISQSDLDCLEACLILTAALKEAGYPIGKQDDVELPSCETNKTADDPVQ
jgi:hypothetical protein